MDGIGLRVPHVRSPGIRAFEPEDLAAVASIYELTMRSGSTTPTPGLAEYFERVLDHPWADPEVPSLVYVNADGKVAGFLASHVRRMVLDGRPLRLACSGPLVVDVASRNRAAGALLARQYLAGPQDLTITDGATPLIRQMWAMLGGVTVQLRSLDWIKILRPARLAGGRLLHMRGMAGGTRLLDRVAAAPDRLLGRTAALATPAPAGVRAERLDAPLLLSAQARFADDSRLHPDYDAPYLAWLFGELEAVRTRGPFVARLLRRGDDTVVGWYVAFMPARDVTLVLQVAARPRDMGVVVDHLLHEAREHGATAVRGRLEPQLMESVAARGCLFRHAGSTLLHSRNSEIAAIAQSGSAMLTMLEGEYWMEPHRL